MNPDDYTLSEFYLDVGDSHSIYVQDWGYRASKNPIIFLHGGPGSGVHDSYKTSFDPGVQRVIFFDQRGSGKSTPYGSLVHNDTAKLINDIKLLTEHLGLEQYIVSGGSWGACLALAYTLKHPQQVSAVVIRGVFTGSKFEMDWLGQAGFKTFFPDIWQDFVASVPEKYQHQPSKYHIDRALGSDADAAKESAFALYRLEGSVLSLDERKRVSSFADFDPTASIIEAHYLKNLCFLEDRYILDHASELTMPVYIIQGRYDMVCPPVTAYELAGSIPSSRLFWTMAGHGNDRSNFDIYRTLLLQLTGSL